jgi:hypothetical protein
MVSLDAIVNDARNEVLRCFCVFLCHHTSALSRLLSVFLRLLIRGSTIRVWAEDSGCGEDLIKMLKLLSCSLLVSINHCLLVYTGNVRETIYDKSTQ